jgi:hypothetical protein
MKLAFGSGLIGREKDIAKVNGALGLLLGMGVAYLIAGFDNRLFFYVGSAALALICVWAIYDGYKNVRKT